MRMLFKDKPLPAFDYITFWNDYNPYYSTPEGIEPQSAGSINNSFVMISAADHSVVDKGIEYGAEKGRIVVQYGYNLSVPEDDIAQEGSVCSTGEPGDYFGGPKENKLGECATKYTNSKDRTYLEVSQDGVKISAGPREEYDYARLLRYPYTLSKQSRFDLTTEHYEWEEIGCCQFKYCCTGGLKPKCGHFESCGCEQKEYTCKLDDTDTETSLLTLTDSKTILPQPILPQQDTRVKVMPGTSSIKASVTIDTQNIQSYEIETLSQKFKKVMKSYKVKWKHAPFNSFYLETVFFMGVPEFEGYLPAAVIRTKPASC